MRTTDELAPLQEAINTGILLQRENKMRTTDELAPLQEAINTGILLQEVLKTKGWEKVIHPLWEKEMASVVGGKVDGRWVGGRLSGKCRKDETIAYYIGKKDALMDFYNGIQAMIQEAENAKKQLKFMQEGKNKESVKVNTYET